MPSTVVLEGLSVVALALIASLVASWASSRYGQTEKRYLISGAASLTGIAAILLYQFLTKRWHFLVGYYIGVFYLVQWTMRLQMRRKDH